MNCSISKNGSLGTAQHIGREGKLIYSKEVEIEVKNRMIIIV